MVDASDSKSDVRKNVWVRVPPPVFRKIKYTKDLAGDFSGRFFDILFQPVLFAVAIFWWMLLGGNGQALSFSFLLLIR